MKYKDRLVRDNVTNLLEDRGFTVNKEKLDERKYKLGLYSLFVDLFKESKVIDDNKSVELCEIYADMLEIIKTIAKADQIHVKDIIGEKESSPIDWYTQSMPDKIRLYLARTNLLNKFYQLLSIKNKEVRLSQLKELIKDFKEVLNAHHVGFNQVELKRRDRLKNLGGYSQGVYINSVEKDVTQQV